MANRKYHEFRPDWRELTAKNLGLVPTILKRRLHGRPITDDLIQAGNIGLMMAAQRYDESRGIAFSTYATYWIMQSVQRHIRQDRLIHIPEWIFKASMESQAGHQSRFIKAGKRLLECKRRSIEQAEEWNSDLIKRTLSVEADFLGGIESQEEIDELRERIARLQPREAEIIDRRFGLSTRQPETLGQIGESLGLTRERIRQIERGAIRKLQTMMMEVA